MECLIAVCLGVGEPVAQTIGVRLVDLRDGHVDVEALVDLLFSDARGEDDAYREDIIDFLEGNVLVLHLVPDRVGGLYSFLDLILDAHLLQRVLDGVGELGKQFVARHLCRLQLRLDGRKVVGVLELEAEILEFRLDLVQSQAVSQWCVDIERLSRNLILLVGRLRVEGAHVVQTVADLNEDHADIVAHRQQQLFEVLCLCRGLLTEDTTRDLRQTVDDLCYLCAEDVLDILYGVVGILHHVVEQCRADTCRAESYLRTGNLRYGDGVHDVGFA